MADEQQAVTAETSTATGQENPFASGKLTPEIEKSFREGNEVAPVKKQNSGSAEPSAKETKSEPNGKSASESEAGKKEQERGKSSAEDRIGQLTAREKAANERAEKAERERDELRAAQTKPKEEAKPVQAQPASDDPEPKEPKWEDYAEKPYGEYQAALNKYNRELAMWAGRQEFKKHQAEQQQAELQKTVTAQVEEARKAYKDWDAVAKPAMELIMGDMKDMVNTGAHLAVKQAINESPYAAHILYVLATGKEGDTVADFVKLSRTNPRRALMKLGAIETLLVPELAKAQKEIEDQKGKANDPPVKTATVEPKPLAKPNNEVGNRGTGPNDVAADAVRRGDTRTAMAEWTRKAAQRRGIN